MKKISHILISLIFLINISACAGYKPIFSSTSLQFEISNYDIEGDKILGNKLYSKLSSLSKSKKVNPDTKNLDLLINVSKTKSATSKDSSGKILEYKINLNTKIKITDFITGKKLLEKNFNSSLNYKIQDQYSDTIKLENKSTGNLINLTYQELLIKLSENILSK